MMFSRAFRRNVKEQSRTAKRQAEPIPSQFTPVSLYYPLEPLAKTRRVEPTGLGNTPKFVNTSRASQPPLATNLPSKIDCTQLEVLSATTDKLLELKIGGDKIIKFPYSFLRDTCASNFHPSTGQRVNAMRRNILSSRPQSLHVVPNAAEDEQEKILEIQWKISDNAKTEVTSEENEFPLTKTSRYSASWLLDHSMERTDADDRRFSELRLIQGLTAEKFADQAHNRPIDFSKIVSPQAIEEEINLLRYGAVASGSDDSMWPVEKDCESEAELVRLFATVWKHGLVYVDNVPSELCELENEHPLSAVGLLAKRTSFLKQTNYGRTFNVYAKPSANNQAYTNQTLPLHTDLPFYKVAPDIQMLHCINPAPPHVGGGESVFCDGVAAALKLKETDYAAYRILCDTKVQYHDYSEGKWFLRADHPVIEEVSFGDSAETFITQVFINEGVRSTHINQLRPEQVDDFYKSLIKFSDILNKDKELRIEFGMGKDQMCIFNNNRVLHGRNAFGLGGEAGDNADNQKWKNRFLQGAYVDWDDVLSRLRIFGHIE